MLINIMAGVKLIKPITSDHDLIELAEILGVHIDDILSIDEVTQPLDQHGTYIILLKPEEGGIGHWVCLDRGVYFDSMGEPAPDVLQLYEYNRKQLQGTYSFYCGCWCILWLYARQKKRLDLLDGLHDLNWGAG